MTNNEVPDQIVSMTLKGIETVAKISGLGAKNIAVYLYAVLNDQKRTKGKARLQSMLKSEKRLKIFAVKKEDLPSFVREAKKYGVLYAVLKDKKDIDGICDIMVRAEDAAKINRIVERFKFSAVDMADIRTETSKQKEDKTGGKKQAARTEKKIPSEPFSSSKENIKNESAKPSVRAELETIKKTQVKKTAPTKTKTKQKIITKG